MIPLGTAPLRITEDIAATRNKLLGLARALQFDPVLATRIAFAVSEQSRSLLQAGRCPELQIGLDHNDNRTHLVLQFQDSAPLTRTTGLAEFFDTVQAQPNANGHGHVLELRIAAPPSAVALDEALLRRERSRLAQKTRTQLMEQLQITNAQLERYNSQLEQMVAARTAELQKAYEKIKKDLETAADYVRRLLPSEWTAPIGIRWKYVPSAELGGDIFGYHAIDSDNLAIYLLDVTGHGVDSALLAVSIANVIRSASLPDVDFRRPCRVLEALNIAFPMDQCGEKLFTIWYGVFNTATQTLRWSGGGHPAALLYASGASQPRRLDSTGPMVGMIPDFQFGEGECRIDAPMRMFVYSDGAHEIHTADGTTWSYEAFVQYVSHIHPSADPLQALLDHVRQLHGGEQLDDDFSAMEVRW